jgi:hypothetical protein
VTGKSRGRFLTDAEVLRGADDDERAWGRVTAPVNASKVCELGETEGLAFGAILRQVVKYLCALFAMVVAKSSSCCAAVRATYSINDKQIVTRVSGNAR